MFLDKKTPPTSWDITEREKSAHLFDGSKICWLTNQWKAKSTNLLTSSTSVWSSSQQLDLSDRSQWLDVYFIQRKKNNLLVPYFSVNLRKCCGIEKCSLQFGRSQPGSRTQGELARGSSLEFQPATQPVASEYGFGHRTGHVLGQCVFDTDSENRQ